MPMIAPMLMMGMMSGLAGGAAGGIGSSLLPAMIGGGIASAFLPKPGSILTPRQDNIPDPRSSMLTGGSNSGSFKASANNSSLLGGYN